MPDPAPPIAGIAPSVEEEEAIFAERMDYASIHARPSMWLAAPASVITCGVLYTHVPNARLLGWLGAILVTYAARALGVVGYRRRARLASTSVRRRWAWITAALAVPTGFAWSLLPLWAAAPGGALGLVAVVVVIAAAAVAMRGLSPLWGIYAAFVLTMLAPIAVASIAQGDGAGRALGIATSIYTVSILLVARQGEAEFRRRALLELRMRALLARLETAKATAEIANAAKSQFIANVSHEVRTPLQGLLGLTDLLLGSSLDEKQRTHMEVIHRSGRGLLRILNDLLDFSKLEAGKLELVREPLALRAVVREVVELYSAGAEAKAIALSGEVSPEVPDRVLGDALRLAEILGNLVSNALKFTERGAVTVTLSLAHDGLVRLSVRDTGIGLSAEQQRRVFDAFTQADASTTRRYGGTGLGLSIVKHLVELHEGRLGVESEPGKGSEFWCELRLDPAPGATAETAESAAPPQATVVPAPSDASARPPALPSAAPGGDDVLVAEDNAVNRMVVVAVLDSLGVRHRLAVDGVEAVNAFTERAPALILMDSQMPRLGGCDAAVAIRKLEVERGLGRTPIVALTANAAPGDREACLAAGMNDFLPKPFTVAELRACVTRWLRAPPA